MVSIGKLSLGQERYYLEQAPDRIDAVESGGGEDYYLDPAEARGEWHGRAAARLVLTGPVGADALRRVLAAQHPVTGVALRELTARSDVAAFDLTFSPPKSVSVLFALGGEDVVAGVRVAHEYAVREAFGYFERTAPAVRRGHNGVTVLPADGLVAAAFRHRSSRAGDPQLHTHVLVVNLGCGPDGRWSALDGRRVFAQARTASAVYQAVLRGEMSRRVGVEWTPVVKGIAEIKGVPAAVAREFSRRRADIEAAMAERGVAGPAAAQIATLDTRQGKRRDVDAADLREQWRARAAELGFTAADVPQLLGREAPELSRKRWEQLVDELAGADGLTPRPLDVLATRRPARDLRPPSCRHRSAHRAAGGTGRRIPRFSSCRRARRRARGWRRPRLSAARRPADPPRARGPPVHDARLASSRAAPARARRGRLGGRCRARGSGCREGGGRWAAHAVSRTAGDGRTTH